MAGLLAALPAVTGVGCGRSPVTSNVTAPQLQEPLCMQLPRWTRPERAGLQGPAQPPQRVRLELGEPPFAPNWIGS